MVSDRNLETVVCLPQYELRVATVTDPGNTTLPYAIW